MKTASAILVGLSVLRCLVWGQRPVIESFGTNGVLVCTNLLPASVAEVEWAPTASGPWTNTWAGLTNLVVDANGTVLIQVPMFYRVRGQPKPSIPPGMVLIPAGPFLMGDSLDHTTKELPVHTTQVGAFYMDKYEVTGALWDEVRTWALGHGYTFNNNIRARAPDHPVVVVTWYDAVKWCNARSEIERKLPAYYTSAAQSEVYRSGKVDVENEWVKWDAGYRLPTEAEWEKAARAGASGHRFPWFDTETITHSRANYKSDHGYAYDVSPTEGYHPTFETDRWPLTSPVGYFAPNAYGLYDMVGNAWEWCWDWYGAYSASPATDPRGPTSGVYRVARGGGWYHIPQQCRTAWRGGYNPSGFDLVGGFRSVLPPDPPRTGTAH
jgi:formylglycine-generating enzyme required for sulfatase activity